MNWISKQNAQRKANLLKYNPVVDHASKGPEQGGKILKKKIQNLSNKHKGLYNAVIEGHGQNQYTSGDHDADYKKLEKVEDKLENKLGKWKKRFGEDFSQWDDSPSMEGPLNDGLISMKNKKPRIEVEVTKTPKKKYLQLTKTKRPLTPKEVKDLRPNMEGPLNKNRLSKTIGKAEAAYDEGNYKKAYRKGKSAARQAKRHGVMSSEEAKSFKQDMKSSLGMDMQGPLKKKNWIQDATASIKARGTEGVCTGDKFGSASCPPGSKRYNLAKTFKKMAKNR
jgi:hypothetical protein